jgi:hypothetical protein
MVNGNSAEIQLAGEKHVESWLSGNGYNNIEKQVFPSNERLIKAAGVKENILIRVSTFVHPHRPFKLSDFETDKLTRKASKLKLTAYAAYVVLNAANELAEEIVWERLF